MCNFNNNCACTLHIIHSVWIIGLSHRPLASPRAKQQQLHPRVSLPIWAHAEFHVQTNENVLNLRALNSGLFSARKLHIFVRSVALYVLLWFCLRCADVHCILCLMCVYIICEFIYVSGSSFAGSIAFPLSPIFATYSAANIGIDNIQGK